MLKAYQKPFRYFEGNFESETLKLGDVINFEVPNDATFSARSFMVNAATFDLKQNTITDCLLSEIFSKNINTKDVSIPLNDGDSIPGIVQNANNPSPDTINGIFTEEFTEQFL